MSNTVNCYRCGNQVRDKDSFDANAFPYDDCPREEGA